jgi:O-antigen ligase
MSASEYIEARYGDRPRQISAGVRRLALAYLWITIASIAIVVSDPAPYDALILGAVFVLPIAGLIAFPRGLALYLLLWSIVIGFGFIASTQAVVISKPMGHMGITLYLALSSIVVAAFVADRPPGNTRLLLSAYFVSAAIAAIAALIGYFNLAPGAYDLFTEFGRARGTFKDANVLGAFLVPALVYAFNSVMTRGILRAWPMLFIAPLLLFATLLTFSRGAWINLAVALLLYAFFTFGTAGTNRQRLKLVLATVLAAVLAVGVLAAATSIPEVADLMGERSSFEQSYDVGPEGRFGGQLKAIGLILSHPLGLGALEFHEHYHHEDVHEVYLSMFLNAGWIGGMAYIVLVMITIGLGLRCVLADRGGDGLSAVLAASFIAMAFEGAVIDTDHWRHFFLLMAMVWGMALGGAKAGAKDRHVNHKGRSF